MADPSPEPTEDQEQHLLQAMKDTAEGWKLHLFTVHEFTRLGWLDEHGWTQAAYDARRAALEKKEGV